MINSALVGFSLTIALVAAIGAQNAFVLRQGLRREHVIPVVLTCAASDALLIGAGIAGMGALVAGRPTLVTALRWLGAAFLLCYSLLAARRALRAHALRPGEDPPATPLWTTLLTCLAFTYLNPHVYLDTVLLLGGVGQQHSYRWVFWVAATTASLTWFTVLGVGAYRLSPLLARPAVWRILDGVVAVMMATLAVALLLV